MSIWEFVSNPYALDRKTAQAHDDRISQGAGFPFTAVVANVKFFPGCVILPWNNSSSPETGEDSGT